MRRIASIAVLVVSGLAIVLTGLTGLASPQSLFTPLGISIEGASAHNEIRAAYGGMHVAIGLLLFAGAARASFRRAALWTGLAFTGGLTAGRLVSLAIDGAPNGFVLRLLSGEAAAAIVMTLLLLTDGAPPER